MAIFIVGQFFSEADKNFVFLSLTKQSFYRACDFQPQKPMAEKSLKADLLSAKQKNFVFLNQSLIKFKKIIKPYLYEKTPISFS